MTQEEKTLLLQDLCARLPYGVKVDAYSYSTTQTLYSIDVFRREYTLENGDSGNLFVGFDKLIFSNVKPYLRPMSSMTEEERGEFRMLGGVMSYSPQHNTWAISAFSPEAYDWLNKKMFDFRGLIPMGLALEAPEGMYNTKTE